MEKENFYSFIMKFKILYHFLFILALLNCTREPKSDMANIGEERVVESAKKGISYEIDTSASLVTWVGTKPTGRHNGIFRIKSGTINVVEETIDSTTNKKSEKRINSANIIIDISTIDILDLKHDPVQYRKLLNHLKSKDFLSIEEFPIATFELISIKLLDKDSTERIENEFTIIDPTHTITGNLTIKGITKSIEFPVKIDMRNLKVEASARFNINRTVWDIDYLNENDAVARVKDSFINNIVNVGFEILAFSQTP